jgi:stage III sporulation protein AH
MNMKSWKRNALMAAVLVLVCGGIYWNWRYEENRAVDLVSTLDAEKILDDAALVLASREPDPAAAAAQEPAAEQSAEQVFAQMRLSRQQSRDSAVHLLQETISYAGEDEDVSASTLQLDAIVKLSLAEANIESVVISKGYADCVAYMTDDGISLAVAAPEAGLAEADVALLTDIVCAQTDYELPQIRIIEVG